MASPFVVAVGMAFLPIVILSAAGNAAADRQPSPLIIDGRPIDTTCLMTLSNGDSSRRDPIDIRRCHRGDIAITHGSPDPGMIGFEYQEKEVPDEHPYFYYRSLGAYRGHALLFLEFGGGGTGRFTSLVSVDRVGSLLKPAEELAGGDRCNGGIFLASVDRGRLSYDERITPYDLVALAGVASKLEAYKDLEASAASCVAVVHRQDRQWTSVTLSNPDLHDERGWTEQYRYQSCFNRIYRDFVARRKTELDRGGISAFGMAFASGCLEHH